MPKVWVFGKEGSTALHCQEPGQTSPGLRHWRSFRQKGAVGPALPKSWANCTGFAWACGRNIMPKSGFLARKGLRRCIAKSPGLRHWRSFRQRSAVGLALPKSRANGIGLARAYGRNIMPKVRVFGKEGSTAPHYQKPGPTALEVFSAKRCRRSSLAEILGELHWVCLGLRQEYLMP